MNLRWDVLIAPIAAWKRELAKSPSCTIGHVVADVHGCLSEALKYCLKM